MGNMGNNSLQWRKTRQCGLSERVSPVATTDYAWAWGNQWTKKDVMKTAGFVKNMLTETYHMLYVLIRIIDTINSVFDVKIRLRLSAFLDVFLNPSAEGFKRIRFKKGALTILIFEKHIINRNHFPNLQEVCLRRGGNGADYKGVRGDALQNLRVPFCFVGLIFRGSFYKKTLENCVAML